MTQETVVSTRDIIDNMEMQDDSLDYSNADIDEEMQEEKHQKLESEQPHRATNSREFSNASVTNSKRAFVGWMK